MSSNCRIVFLIVLIFTASFLHWSCSKQETSYDKLNFNSGWKFFRGELENESVIQINFDDSNWEDVHLPHTPQLTPLRHPYPLPDNQGINWYRKQFFLPGSYENKKIYIEFEGADQIADVWINGRFVTTHSGAFTPFWIDITEQVKTGSFKNLLCVKVTNFRTPDIPVYGNWISYGGLYRDVYLHVKDFLHITDPIYAKRIAGGGIFATYPFVSDSLAKIKIQTHVLNESQNEQNCQLTASILDRKNKKIAAISSQQIINSGNDYTFSQSLTIKDPELWHPDHPNLYTLVAEVHKNGSLVDVQKTKIGIRRIEFRPEKGFSINGKRLVFMGANRVQDYPYLAWAGPNNLQKRDAALLKEAGFQYVRLSHNLQDPAFLNACDEFGLLVMACIPGFQYVGGEKFKDHSFQDMRDLIRRDRNHPSIVLWELSLNETEFDSSFAQQAMVIGHEEFPGDQCFISGWKFDNIYDVYIRATQHGARDYAGNAPLVISEYGHWDYGGGNSSSDVERKNGESAMLVQAKNHQESLNANRALPFLCGDGLWVGIDFQTYPSGIIDYFRLPKFSCYFFQSQRNPYLKYETLDSGPMIVIANYWSEKSPRDVKVFSNCDSVQLILNGKGFRTQTPDPDSISKRLLHPPFTFHSVPFRPGELKAVGYLDGKPIVHHIRRTPEKAQSLQLKLGIENQPAANGEDIFFVYANIVDKNGTLVPESDAWINFAIEGEANLLSPNRVRAEAGTAAALVRVTQHPGKIEMKITNSELQSAEKVIVSR